MDENVLGFLETLTEYIGNFIKRQPTSSIVIHKCSRRCN